jgi:hypothetical protein
VCALFDNCTGDYKSVLKKFALLGCAPMNDINKLRGCYFVTKEDCSVFLNPILQLPPFEAQITTKHTMHQTMMDDAPGCCLSPTSICCQKKRAHPAPTKYLCKICNKSIALTNALTVVFAAKAHPMSRI